MVIGETVVVGTLADGSLVAAEASEATSVHAACPHWHQGRVQQASLLLLAPSLLPYRIQLVGQLCLRLKAPVQQGAVACGWLLAFVGLLRAQGCIMRRAPVAFGGSGHE